MLETTMGTFSFTYYRLFQLAKQYYKEILEALKILYNETF
jgi:hypothetical protein